MTGDEITYDEIRENRETVEVDRLALIRAYQDGLFTNTGNAHERMAKNRLKDDAERALEDG